jgi:hypothetical protein
MQRVSRSVLNLWTVLGQADKPWACPKKGRTDTAC